VRTPRNVAVLEASHLGGCRFAANAVCLPEGLYFGRVGSDLNDLIDTIDLGRLPLERFRGRCSLPPPAQAAEYFARTALKRTQLRDFKVVAHREVDANRFESSFRIGAALVTASVSRVRAEVPRRTTCSSATASAPWHWRLDMLAVA
jgi:hypothetical protein